MTYLSFHFLFTIPLLFVVLFLNRKNSDFLSKTSIAGAGLLLILAFTYTTPWDSYLISQKIWSYHENRILISFWLIPIEEYFFFIIQTVIGCSFAAFLLWKTKENLNKKQKLEVSQKQLITIFAVLMVSYYFLFNNKNFANLRYLSLVLFWGLPIICMQLIIGFKVLKQYYKTWIYGVGFLTLYFWLADSFAISQEIWFFGDHSISGIEMFSILPIEEALFFLFTNLMVIQGYILFTRLEISYKSPLLNGFDNVH